MAKPSPIDESIKTVIEVLEDEIRDLTPFDKLEVLNGVLKEVRDQVDIETELL